MSPLGTREAVGSARPVVLALMVLVAAAAIILAYALLTRETTAPPPTPPRDVKEQAKPLPKHPLPYTGTRPTSAALPRPATKVTTLPTPTPPSRDAIFWEDFALPTLSPTKWLPTREGDFKEAVTDVQGGRLRIRVGTIGTRDDTVKHLGLRSTDPVVDLTQGPMELSAEIDWNNQANGCYLQASIFICPTATDKTAAAERDWLKFEYVGVPPGRNARACLSRRRGGNLRLLHTEGWPDKQKSGRLIGRQHVILRLDRENIQVIENGKPLYGPEPHGCDFARAYIYLEVLSHSNYPPREIFFDNILLRRAKAGDF